MTTNEVATFLAMTGERVETMVNSGYALPRSGTVVHLAATVIGSHIDISEEQLDAFIKLFEDEESGRHPPMSVRRDLLHEAGYRCGICREHHPLQYHHLTDWAKLKHHDPQHMLAVCGTCHTKCTNGMYDHKAQMRFKQELQRREAVPMDATEASKYERDKKTLTDILSGIPAYYIHFFLEELKHDHYLNDLPIDLDGLRILVNSPQFYLYDARAWQLLKDFFSYWTVMTLRGSCLLGGGRASQIDDDPRLQDHHGQFKKLLAETNRSLAALHAHVREKYPEIDIDALGTKASREAKELEVRVREEMKVRMQKAADSVQ